MLLSQTQQVISYLLVLGYGLYLWVQVTLFVRIAEPHTQVAFAVSNVVLGMNTTSAFREMPSIDFPSVQFPDPSKNYSVAPFTRKEGCEAKFHIVHNNQRFIFKPANRARLTSLAYGYIHYSKGWVTQKQHPSKILNELIAFRVSELLQLSRVPPVIPFQVPLEMLLQTVQQKRPLETPSEWFSSYVYTSECRMDFEVADAWVISRQNNRHAPMVIGSLQFQMEDIVERTHNNPWYISSWLPFQYSRHVDDKDSITQIREENTRLLFDYLIGNWDRHSGASNDFVHAPRRGREQLVYIDQNALRKIPEPFPLHWKGCRFFHRSIQQLQQVNWGAEALWADLVQEYELVESWTQEGVLKLHQLPWRYWQQRADAMLQFVEQCVEKYGATYVYQEDG